MGTFNQSPSFFILHVHRFFWRKEKQYNSRILTCDWQLNIVLIWKIIRDSSECYPNFIIWLGKKPIYSWKGKVLGWAQESGEFWIIYTLALAGANSCKLLVRGLNVFTSQSLIIFTVHYNAHNAYSLFLQVH